MTGGGVRRRFAEGLSRLLAEGGFGQVSPARLIVGFSGGADSTALLTLVRREFPQIPLMAAHLHHGLRGADADGDAAFCRSFCMQHSIPYRGRRVDAAAYARTNRLNLEDAARRLRRRFFVDVARESGRAAAVLLAHHRDDQVETVLMRMMRGSGWRGLCGMRPQSRLVAAPEASGASGASEASEVTGKKAALLLRPLLEFSREELVSYLQEIGIEWREDKSNTDAAYTRNRLRTIILPALRCAFPDCRQRLLRAAAQAARVEEFIADGVERVLRGARQEYGGFFLPFPERKGREALQNEQVIWQRAAEELAGRLPGGERLRADNFTELNALLTGGKRAVTLAGTIRARRERVEIVSSATRESEKKEGIFFCLEQPERTERSSEFPAAEFTYQAEDATLSARVCTLSGELPERGNPYVEYLDLAALRLPLCWRAARPEELVLWRGGVTERTAGHLMKDLGTPQRYRERAYVLADREGPVWLPPLRIAQRCQCSGYDEPVLRVEYDPVRKHGNII